MNWRIVAIDEYINQVSQFPIDIQDNIQQQWIRVAKQDDLNDVKNTRCPQGHDYYKKIFQSLNFNFIFKIDENNRTIELINCQQLDFSKYDQE